MAKLGDMSRATFLARDNICSENHANVSERQQKHFLSPWHRGHVARLFFIMFSHPGRHAEYNVAIDMSPNLAIALLCEILVIHSIPSPLVVGCLLPFLILRTSSHSLFPVSNSSFPVLRTPFLVPQAHVLFSYQPRSFSSDIYPNETALGRLLKAI